MRGDVTGTEVNIGDVLYTPIDADDNLVQVRIDAKDGSALHYVAIEPMYAGEQGWRHDWQFERSMED